jgi:hypothetical protein
MFNIMLYKYAPGPDKHFRLNGWRLPGKIISCPGRTPQEINSDKKNAQRV